MNTMPSQPDNTDTALDRFDSWLQSSRVRPKADLLRRTRQRIAAGEDPADGVLDVLLMQDPELRNPRMAELVRQRLTGTESPARVVYLWKWLAPVAAAAAIAMVISLFNTGAPDGGIQPTLDPAGAEMARPANDPELDRIFALASNLPAPTDISKLQSVDQLALLFE